MSIFQFINKYRRKKRALASSYTNIHPAGYAFYIRGRLANLWEATNPKGKHEYFIMDHEICWNTMCNLSNNHIAFSPDSDDFLLEDVDSYVNISEIYTPAKDEKKVWVFKSLIY